MSGKLASSNKPDCVGQKSRFISGLIAQKKQQTAGPIIDCKKLAR